GINEVQVTASRTGRYAGIDPPRFGPDITRTFAGRAKTDAGWRDVTIEVTYPEWCALTVYRLVEGQRCPFTETVFWEETYSRAGGANAEVPTAMWIKRPRGQLIKCAKAAALRAAFPEESSYTAEEMAGKTIEPEEMPASPAPRAPQAPEPEATSEALSDAFKAQVAKLVTRAQKARIHPYPLTPTHPTLTQQTGTAFVLAARLARARSVGSTPCTTLRPSPTVSCSSCWGSAFGAAERSSSPRI
ncbi:recombinase RecT, partial [uncultured Thiohalocapsa sp.]|uniref:recombinase RecT n=1 Tax=uncultured Thiohalocapsa sp. TaxID=768990 RepID=UPI0025D78176